MILGSRKVIMIAALGGIMLASYNENSTAVAVVVVGWFIALQCHAIEVKLNKLLDHHRLFVGTADLEDN